MIIAHHVAVHSDFAIVAGTVSVDILWIKLLKIGGKIGVNIFVLISGYFLITANSAKTSKVLKIWLQLFSYSVVIFLAVSICGAQPFGVKALIKRMLPISYTQWWFASTYFVLYLISPFINKMLNAFTKKEYQRFLLLLLFCWSIVPTITNMPLESNSLLWFLFLYAVSGYIRLYVDVAAINSRKCIIIALVVLLLTYLCALLLDMLGTKISFFAKHAVSFFYMEKLHILIVSLMLFMGFAGANIGYKPFINIVSSSCFGIYLIHDDSYIRVLLWKTLFKNSAHQYSNYLIPYTILQIVSVFAICAGIELLRINFVEKMYLKPLNTLSNWIDKKKDEFFSLRFFKKM